MVKLLQDLGVSEGWEFSRIGALRLRKQGFTAAQRWAVWIVHGEKCYLDGHPIDLQSMQVDHVIPESLVEEPDRLAQVLHDFGLAPDFDLNSYENWMPACGTHNNQKRAKVFTPTPLIQMHLQRAADKAGKAREIERQSISRVAFAKASNVVMREAEALGISTEEFVSFLNQLINARTEDDPFNQDAFLYCVEPRVHRKRNLLSLVQNFVITMATALMVFVGSWLVFGPSIGPLLFVCLLILGIIGFYMRFDFVVINWIGPLFSKYIKRDGAGACDIPEGIDEYVLRMLRSTYNTDDIQLTPTVSISFDKALQLTGRRDEL
ncbi:HNH endonuclease signature motif containing protein [Rhizobium ruizarguesonis]